MPVDDDIISQDTAFCRIPSCTYRLQLNREFTVKDVIEVLPYLHDLGVDSLYVSPILKSRRGSPHGYDVVDHDSFNPEIGTAKDFQALAQKLGQTGIGLIVDIVPNHVCVADSENWRWIDVLENGPSSTQACFFDIDWQPPRTDLEDKVLIPVLADQYGRVLENSLLPVSVLLSETLWLNL